MSESIFVEVNKTRIRTQAITFGVAAIAAIIVSFGFADNQEIMSPMIPKAVGSGLCFLLILAGGARAKRLKGNNAGILFEGKGITDSISEISVGLIEKKDISGIESINNRFLLIMVKNPEKYLKKAKNSAIRRLLDHNVKQYDTPIVFDSKMLMPSFEELESIANNLYKKYHK